MCINLLIKMAIAKHFLHQCFDKRSILFAIKGMHICSHFLYESCFLFCLPHIFINRYDTAFLTKIAQCPSYDTLKTETTTFQHISFSSRYITEHIPTSFVFFLDDFSFNPVDNYAFV